jgi:hypothetical protein
MAVYSQSDTNAFFSDASVVATYKVGKSRFNVRGIFDSPYQGVNVADSEFASERITFVIPSNNLPVNAEPGDKFVYDCDIYTVREIQPDGTGVTSLILEASTELDEPT